MAARPSRLFVALVVLSAALYLPLSQTVGAMHWFELGPFTAQTSRIGHYALYFAIGAVLGTQDLDRGLMQRTGALARHWLRWTNLSVLVFVVAMAVIVATFIALSKGSLGRALWFSADLGFVVSGAATSLMWLALCARFGHGGGRVWASLARNAYGMFLVHYVYVAWLQYALLDAALPGVAKGALVFVGTVLLSWGTTAALRRIPTIGRLI
jgi:surface polysaccharide O-acyltransferase-like enzyme